MKTCILQIGLPAQGSAEVQRQLAEHGPEEQMLLGQEAHGDQTLLAVRLPEFAAQRLLPVLGSLFERELISFFQMIRCHLCKVVFRQADPSCSLRDFPLRPGETWFASSQEQATLYICLFSPTLSAEQFAWLTNRPEILQWVQAS